MKLTVLIPVFNTKSHQLLESVYCIMNQDDGIKHDVIIIDDGSTSTDTLQSLMLISQIYDVKIIYLPKNSGTSIALNEGHSHVKTEYVAIMGSDDVCSLSRFRLQTAYLAENKDVDVLGTNLFSFKDNDIQRKSIFTSRHEEIPDTSKSWVVNHGTVIYRNSAVLEIGGYDVNFKRGQDVNLWKRMIEAGYVFRNLPQVLYGWRRR